MSVMEAPEGRLDELATLVRHEYKRSKDALGDAVEAYFACGRALLEARHSLPTDQAFGAWFNAQEFGFSQRWALTLRSAAEHEPEVRAAVGSQLPTGKGPNIEKAVKQVTAVAGERGEREVTRKEGEWPTVVIDPPWRYDNVATRGAAEDHYGTMTLDELGDIQIPAAENAHLYLWTTNGFLREAFDLLDLWGFTYKTTLTWCKPSIGMGNYFRNNTEHVLFGLKGKQPTLRNDVPTWFEAPKTQHSAKPESFYDLVETCSPGPWLEMFARRRRFNWDVWGNEA